MSGAAIDHMDLARWRRVERVLDEVLELEPEAVGERLESACAGDLGLRRDVEALLHADREAREFLIVPAAELLPPLPPATQAPEIRPSRSLAPDAGVPAPSAIGRYAILGELGRGGMGIVYLGRDAARERTVAIKVLPDSVAQDAGSLAWFLSEARALAALHHPNVAAIHGVERHDGRRYLVLERVEGDTLADLLREGALPVARALEMCEQVADAMAAAHALGIVHRDLKPGNLMITRGGLVKVLDFGLATHAGRRAPQPDERALEHGPAAPGTAMSRTAARLGTPGYMSPEQILGRPQDARTDLFAFGCVLYQCLTGHRAFAGATPHAVIAATLHDPADLSRLPDATPPAVRALITRALDKDPARRLASAAEAAEHLREACVSLRASSSPSPRRDTARNPLRSTASAASRRIGFAASTSGFPGIAACTPFVGRSVQIAAALELLERSRLLSLVGAGGCGKTRLAIEIARHVAFAPDDAWFADLTAAEDELGLVTSVAAATGVRESTIAPLVDALARRLDGRPGLLVLDNADSALASCSALATRVLELVPGMRVIVTSREWLGAGGEQTLRVPPLALPDLTAPPTPVTIADSEAVRMFLACADALPGGFQLDAANAGPVASVCHALDGVPLGLEMTAALLRHHSLETIANDLTRRLQPASDDAKPGASLASAESAPLSAAIQLSYERLAADECGFFRALSVFTGGFSLDGAWQVCEPDLDAFGTLDLLTRLADKSLVTTHRSTGAEPRYRFLEPIRQFARAQSDGHGESETLAARHLDYFLATAEHHAPALLSGVDQAWWLAQLDAEQANIFAAANACETLPGGAEKALRLAGAVWLFWYVRGHFARGRETLARALARPGAGARTPVRAQALFGAGGLAIFQGDYAEGRRWNGDALELFREQGDTLGIGRALNHLALCEGGEGRFGEARERFREAIRIFEQVGDSRRLAVAMNNLGVVERHQGDFAAAYTTFAATWERIRTCVDRESLLVTLINLGLAAVRLGRDEEAARWIDTALAHVADLGARRAGAAALEVAAEILVRRGNAAHAARLFGAAGTLRATIGLRPDRWWQQGLVDLAGALRRELGDAACAALEAEGGRHTFERSIAEARRRLDVLAPDDTDDLFTEGPQTTGAADHLARKEHP